MRKYLPSTNSLAVLFLPSTSAVYSPSSSNCESLITRMCFFPSAMMSNFSPILSISVPLDHITLASLVRTHSNLAWRFSGTVTSFRGTAKSSSISGSRREHVMCNVPHVSSAFAGVMLHGALYL